MSHLFGVHTHTLHLLKLFHSSWMLFLFIIFSFHFSVGSLYRHIFKFNDTFFGRAQLTDEPIKTILLFCYSAFNFFVRISISLHFLLILYQNFYLRILPICTCMLSPFFLSVLNIINHSSFKFFDNSKICAIFNFGSSACSVSEYCVFSLFCMPFKIF